MVPTILADDEIVAARSAGVRVLVADDQPIVREGFSLLLEAVEGFEAVGSASDSDELLSLVHGRTPDVILLDRRFAGEEGTADGAADQAPSPEGGRAAVSLGHQRGDARASRGLWRERRHPQERPGARDPRCDHDRRRGWLVLGRGLQVPSDPVRLAPREQEVLRNAANGMNNREISQSLFISLATTKRHLENIARKFGTSHRAAAVAEGIRRGLVA